MRVVLNILFSLLVLDSAASYGNSTLRLVRQAESEDCILPEHPLRGQWTVYNSRTHFSPGMLAPLGSVLQVSCVEQHKLDGDAAIVCINGQWTTTIGECLKTCPSIYSTPVMSVTCIYNGRERVNCTDAVDGTVAHFKCAPFYEDAGLEMHPAHVCFNGKWSYNEPECLPICGQKSTKNNPTLIVNGSDVPKGDYPWQVALYNVSDKVLICGGSLLNQRVILTAAHCITNEKGQLHSKEMFMVAVGKYYRHFDHPNDTEAQFSEVYEMFKPRQYKGSTQNYLGDIAIIVTKKIFILTTRVQPVCVDWDSKYEKALLDATRTRTGFVSGWGFTKFKKPSPVLKYVEVPLISYDECLQQLVKNDEDFEKFLTDDKLCMGYLNSGTSVCNGDSGGGLVFKFSRRYYIKAVVSLSPSAPEGGCDTQQYTLFTQVSRYINDFILTKETQFKPKFSEVVDCEQDPNCGRTEQKPTKPTTPQPLTSKTSPGSCLLPQHPKFGQWSVFGGGSFSPGMNVESDTILTVQCSRGYQLEGNELVLCNNGTWASSIGPCLTSCPSLNGTSTVLVTCTFKNKELDDCNNPPHGTIAKHTCAPFYEDLLLKNSPRVCYNGTWDSKTPDCIPVCGKKYVVPNLLIINGRKVAVNQYPWHVAIYRGPKRTFICSGILIGQRLILTVAHCLTNWKNELRPKEDFTVGVGKTYSEYSDKRDAGAQFSELEDVVVPLEYKGSLLNLFGDIAILVTRTTLVLSERVVPACVDWASRYNNSGTGHVSGWGFTRPDGDLSEELKALDVPLISQLDCSQSLPADFRMYLTSDKFCAGYLNGTSVCVGDSGGGLVVKHDGRYFVSGILSAAPASVQNRTGCDNHQYALYTDVTRYKSFILQKDAQFKQRDNSICTEDSESDGCKKATTAPKPKPSTDACVLPPHPKFGMWNLYLNSSSTFLPGMWVDSGAIIQITCQSGYALDGNVVILCGNGRWSSEVGECLKMCTARNGTRATKVSCFYKEKQLEDCNTVLHNTLAKYECVPYYEDAEVTRNPIHTCRDGSWDQREPNCKPVCGLKSVTAQPLIISGNIVQKGTYPWHVAIYQGANKQFVCGGSLISPTIIVTGAPCVTNQRGEKQSKDDYTVAAGKYYRKFDESRDSGAQFRRLAEISISEKYRGEVQLYFADIAVLVTSKPFELSSYVQPVCYSPVIPDLEKGSSNASNLMGYVVGWGYTTETGSPSNELRDLKVPIINTSQCRNALPADFTRYLTSDKLCAGYLNNSKALCKGDSGGGLVVKFEGRYYLAGVVSISPSQANPLGCSQNYALYTKVASYANLISQQILVN